MTTKRTARFETNATQESLVTELNARLAPVDARAAAHLPQTPQHPMVFVVGAPRSGTTLTMQWLADSSQFAYPTNFLSRFYAAPYTGSQIQQLTHNPAYDFHGELGNGSGRDQWQSETGKTQGALSPHEFSYFWRRFFPMGQARRLTPEEWLESDTAGFARGWASIESAFGLPVATKGILGQYNISELAELLPTAVFIHTQRDPFFNVQSILAARERVFGSRDAWFSVQPPGYREWLDFSPIQQVVHQVMQTNWLLETAASALPRNRWISQPYEAFCSSPGGTLDGLKRAFAAQGADLPDTFRRTPFHASNQVRVPADQAEEIRSAIQAWTPENDPRS